MLVLLDFCFCSPPPFFLFEVEYFFFFTTLVVDSHFLEGNCLPLTLLQVPVTSQEQEEAKAKMLARRESERAKKKEKKEKRQKNGAHEKEEKKEKKQKHEDKVPSSTALFLSSLISLYLSFYDRNLCNARTQPGICSECPRRQRRRPTRRVRSSRRPR